MADPIRGGDAPESLPVARLWIDGRAEPTEGACLEVPRGATSGWRVAAHLPGRDPFARAYGLSIQLEDGRTLHGRARLVAAADGMVTFEGTEVPGGAWPLVRPAPHVPPGPVD